MTPKFGINSPYHALWVQTVKRISQKAFFKHALGELKMGGQYKVFPKKLRIILMIQLILQMFFVVIILQMGGFMPLWFSDNTTKIICIVMAVYLSFNTVMNFISKSKKEKYVMTPLSAISAVCFWITAL